MPEPKQFEGVELDPCPFCGGALGATLDERGEPDGLVHAMPMCDKFLKLTPEQFLAEREVKLGRGN